MHKSRNGIGRKCTFEIKRVNCRTEITVVLNLVNTNTDYDKYWLSKHDVNPGDSLCECMEVTPVNTNPG